MCRHSFAVHRTTVPKLQPEETTMANKSTKESASFRKELVSLITEEHAHAGFDAAVKNLPVNLRGKCPDGLPHSAYELVEHLGIAQWDIVEYALNPNHKSPDFPDGYWPKSPEPPDPKAWDKSIASFRASRKKLISALEQSDVFAPISHANNQSLAAKTILLLAHNAYHIGQLILLRRLLNAWPEK
jgi:DinB superfamily